ncbi:hypothetical protein PHOSAC3_120803 [Mesotoga infera]|nr:hypothetical protein PHOSAC3_120803 [Mesotoga infera]
MHTGCSLLNKHDILTIQTHDEIIASDYCAFNSSRFYTLDNTSEDT